MRRKYDLEFKLEALRMASEPGVTKREVERRLGIGQGVLSRWKRELARDGEQAFSGSGRLKPEDEDIGRLKRENERLRRERDILKKAVAIFSTDPHRYSGSYLATTTGWLYLTVIIDVFSRMVVGWALSSSLGHEMVVTALKRAIRRRRPGKRVIFHSDRGVQYACGDFRKELAKHEFVQSMSRKGDCWDNAVAESFFAIMKTELVYHERYVGHQDTLHSIFEYIEVFYNRKRRHSSLEYLCPSEYEIQKVKLCA
jgi:putative transposase